MLVSFLTASSSAVVPGRKVPAAKLQKNSKPRKGSPVFHFFWNGSPKPQRLERFKSWLNCLNC